MAGYPKSKAPKASKNGHKAGKGEKSSSGILVSPAGKAPRKI